MKKTVKKIISFVMVAALLFTGSSMVFAEDNLPKVMLNGQKVDFPDAAPENVDGRIMVPFRPILEALGATVDWNAETKTVTATKGEETLSFTIGQPDVAITKAEGASTVSMDVVPYVKNDRTYVGTRFMAEALDYTVGWDQEEQTVIIIDFEEIFGNMEKDFSIMNRLASESGSADMEATYETAMDLQLSLTLAAAAMGAEKDMTLSVAGDVDALTKGLDADMSMTLNLDIEQVMDLLAGDTSAMTEEEIAKVRELQDSLKNVKMDIKMDGESGDIYIRCPLIAQLEQDETLTAETWYKMNLYDFYEDMGIDMKQIMDMATTGEVDLSSMMERIEEIVAADMGVETYDALTGVYGALKAVFGDEAFTKTTSGDVNTYTSEFTGESILNGFIANTGDTLMGEFAAMDAASRQEIMDQLKGISGKVVLSEKDGALQESQISFAMDIEGMKMTLDAKGDTKTADMTMTFDVPDVAKFDLTMKVTSEESSKTVDVTIPQGSKVVDLMKREAEGL